MIEITNKSPIHYAGICFGIQILCAFMIAPILDAHIFQLIGLFFGLLFFGFMFIELRNDWRKNEFR